MTVKLLTEHHLEFLSLKWGCTASSESTLVKMPHGRNHMSRLKCNQASVRNEKEHMTCVWYLWGVDSGVVNCEWVVSLVTNQTLPSGIESESWIYLSPAWQISLHHSEKCSFKDLQQRGIGENDEGCINNLEHVCIFSCWYKCKQKQNKWQFF